MTWPPRPAACSTVASASSTRRLMFQCGGTAAAASPMGAIAATTVARNRLLRLSAHVAGQPPQCHLGLRRNRTAQAANRTPSHRTPRARGVGGVQRAHRPRARLVDELRALASTRLPHADRGAHRIDQHGQTPGGMRVERTDDQAATRSLRALGDLIRAVDADMGVPDCGRRSPQVGKRADFGDIAASDPCDEVFAGRSPGIGPGPANSHPTRRSPARPADRAAASPPSTERQPDTPRARSSRLLSCDVIAPPQA